MKRAREPETSEQVAKRRRLEEAALKRLGKEVKAELPPRYAMVMDVLSLVAGFPAALAKLALAYESCYGPMGDACWPPSFLASNPPCAFTCFAVPEYCEQWLPTVFMGMQALTIMWVGNVAHRILTWTLTASKHKAGKVFDRVFDTLSWHVEPTSPDSTFIHGKSEPTRKVFLALDPRSIHSWPLKLHITFAACLTGGTSRAT